MFRTMTSPGSDPLKRGGVDDRNVPLSFLDFREVVDSNDDVAV